MSVICRKFLLKLALRTYIFLKLRHTSTLSVWTEEIQAKTGEWTKQHQYTVTLFNCDHLTYAIVLFAFAKIYVLLYSFSCVSFWISGQFPSTGPRGWTWRRDLSVFSVTSLGGLMHGEVIFGILRYILIWWKMNELSPPVKRAVSRLSN